MTQILIKGDMTGVSGYSRATRSLAKFLIQQGKDVKLFNRKKENHNPVLNTFWDIELPSRVTKENHKSGLTIWFETPNYYKPLDKNSYNIGMTMFETSGIPKVDLHGNPDNNWVSQMNKMDEIWVPCTFCKEIFQKDGVTTPINVVPLLVEDNYNSGVKPLFPKTSAFSLVSAFQWTPRKDPVSLVLGFYSANLGPEARLFLKTYTSGFGQSQMPIANDIKGMAASFHSKRSNNEINLILENLSDDQMTALYPSADVVVVTSRGEGLCLPVVESMMAGVPAIVPLNTAFKDYTTPANSYQCGTTEYPVHEMGWIPWYSPEQYWYQINFKQLVAALEKAYKDSQKKWDETTTVLQRKGQVARETALKMFSPEIAGKQRLLPVLEKSLQRATQKRKDN